MTIPECKSHSQYRGSREEGYHHPNHFESTGVQFQSDSMRKEDVPCGRKGTTGWSRMQPSQVTKHGAAQENSSALCLICYANHVNAILVPCHHRFHTGCIHSELKSGHCPVCLSVIQSVHQLILPEGRSIGANSEEDVACGRPTGSGSNYAITSSGYDYSIHSAKSGEDVQSTEILRRGKWTREESEYCDRLIEEFKNGNLALAEGTTLRAFLSRLLRCDPMRISKKYTGDQCIGKVYCNLTFKNCIVCNLISDSTQIVFRRKDHAIPQAKIDKARHDLAKLEKAFLERDQLNRQRREKRLRCQYSDETYQPQVFRYTQNQIPESHYTSASNLTSMNLSRNVPFTLNTNTYIIQNQTQTQDARVNVEKNEDISTIHLAEAKAPSLSTSVSAIALASLAQDSLNPSCISQIASFENLVSLFPRVTSFENFALLSAGSNTHIQSGLDITEVFSVSTSDFENSLELKKESDFASHSMELLLTNLHPQRANISIEPQDSAWKSSKSIMHLSRFSENPEPYDQKDDTSMEDLTDNARLTEMNRRKLSNMSDSSTKKAALETASSTTSLEKLSRIASSDFLSRINSADHFTTFGTMSSTSSYGSLTNLVAFGRSCLPRTSSIEDILSLLAPSEASMSTNFGQSETHERMHLESWSEDSVSALTRNGLQDEKKSGMNEVSSYRSFEATAATLLTLEGARYMKGKSDRRDLDNISDIDM